MSKETGANSNVALSGDGSAAAGVLFANPPSVLQKGADTVLHFGDKANGYDVRSRMAKVEGLIEGVTVTALKVDDKPVTVDVKRDVDGMASKVEAMVKAANEALSNIRINSKADLENKGTNKADGTFVSNTTTRDVSTQIRNVFVGSGNAVPSLAGVSLQRDGTITFDKAKFAEAYAIDPTRVADTMKGTADKLEAVGKAASNSTDGSLTVAIRGADALQKDYTEQIKRFDDRMKQREATLAAKYNALDSMLSKMKSQGDWLAGQLAALPNISYGSK